jgi:hypothetical protein
MCYIFFLFLADEFFLQPPQKSCKSQMVPLGVFSLTIKG